MRPAALLAVVVASLSLLAGCGTMGSGGDVTGQPPSGSGATQGGTTELTIAVSAGGGRGERTYSLVCDPAGGDHPDPGAACRLLSELKDPFAPVPPDAMCTEIYGGPQTATVTGTLRGEPVTARFSRTDGCQIARWDKHAVLLVEPGGVEGS
jgi:predicted small secreted protein